MSRFTFHFSADNSYESRLTCGRIAQAIVSRAGKDSLGARASPSRGKLAGSGLAPEPRAAPELYGDDELGDPRDLRDDALWGLAGLVGWAGRSDRLITDSDAAAIVDNLRCAGRLQAVQSAFQRLGRALLAAYPETAYLESSELAHLVALGRDMAESACRSPDLMEYACGEIQPADLFFWLGI